MCRFLVSLIYLSIVGCVFAQNSGRRLQIKGSLEPDVKDDGFTTSRLGEHSGGAHKQSSENESEGAILSDTGTGIGSPSVSLNSILENAGLGGYPVRVESESLGDSSASLSESDGTTGEIARGIGYDGSGGAPYPASIRSV